MYRLPTPIISSSVAFSDSVETIRDKIRREHFKEAANTVQSRCEDFNTIAESQNFNEARASDFEVTELNPGDMSELYDKQFTRGLKTRMMWNNLRNSAPNDLCPYCGDGLVAELDHYLPKKSFAGTTVHPLNLVPACRDCNHAKQAYEPGPDTPALLHPYFDTAYDARWLYASVTKGELKTPTITFSIRFESDPELEKRLRAHMAVFKLQVKFQVKAAQLLANFQRMIIEYPDYNMTADQAQQYLRRIAIQESGGRVNSWQYAAYEAMLKSDWYLTKYLGLN